jgi:hypothetical protein
MLSKREVIRATAVLATLVQVASGALVFDSSIEFSGGTQPAGPAPWLRTTVTDAGANTVTVKFENLNLVGTEFVSKTFLNLNTAFNAANLNFGSPVQVGTFALPSINKGTDAFKADGDGFFDLEFDFATANPQRFGPGESLTYTVSGITGLDETDFNFLSVNGPVGNNAFPVAAHVQGIGANGENSGWVSVPEPASLALLAAAIPMLRRRRPV